MLYLDFRTCRVVNIYTVSHKLVQRRGNTSNYIFENGTPNKKPSQYVWFFLLEQLIWVWWRKELFVVGVLSLRTPTTSFCMSQFSILNSKQNIPSFHPHTKSSLSILLYLNVSPYKIYSATIVRVHATFINYLIRLWMIC